MPAGTKVTGVEYYDDKKQKQVQEASVVVLAAWSAQNPRLLLNSATDKHPKGLANASGLVGKFMMTHHVASDLGDVRRGHREPHGHDRRAVHVLRALCQDQPPGAFGSSFITAGFALKTTDLANSRGDLFGPELADYMKRAARGISPGSRPSARSCRTSKTASN